RVLRTVTVCSYCINVFWNRSIRELLGFLYGEPGYGLNGIRLILHGVSFINSASSRA
ncbi:hypothetical protein D018_2930B, partial [Vibrio parahaemolyticus VP2007-007]